MKKIIRFITRLPFSFFWYFKNAYFYNRHMINGSYSPFIRSLVENGYAIIGKNYGSNIQFNDIQDDIKKITATHELKKSGQEKGRIINPHLLGDNIKKYSDYLTTIAAEYFGNKNIQIEMSLYQKSLPETSSSEIPGGEGFHIDDGKKTLKFFLYLTNVTEKNGPFCYIPKSHGLANWNKFLRIIRWNIFNEHFSLYFDESEIKQNAQICICENQGTVFCADTTGFHKATPLLEGCREVLVVSFNEKRLDLIKRRIN